MHTLLFERVQAGPGQGRMIRNFGWGTRADIEDEKNHETFSTSQYTNLTEPVYHARFLYPSILGSLADVPYTFYSASGHDAAGGSQGRRAYDINFCQILFVKYWNALGTTNQLLRVTVDEVWRGVVFRGWKRLSLFLSSNHLLLPSPQATILLLLMYYYCRRLPAVSSL